MVRGFACSDPVCHSVVPVNHRVWYVSAFLTIDGQDDAAATQERVGLYDTAAQLASCSHFLACPAELKPMRVQAQNDATSAFRIDRLAGRSFSDEFGGTIDNDIALLQAAIIAIAIYTYIAISDCRNGCVGSRAALTLGGARLQRRDCRPHRQQHPATCVVNLPLSGPSVRVLCTKHTRQASLRNRMRQRTIHRTVDSAYGHMCKNCAACGAGLLNIGLAIAASYGFGTYIGLIFSPLMAILPFIILGVVRSYVYLAVLARGMCIGSLRVAGML